MTHASFAPAGALSFNAGPTPADIAGPIATALLMDDPGRDRSLRAAIIDGTAEPVEDIGTGPAAEAVCALLAALKPSAETLLAPAYPIASLRIEMGTFEVRSAQSASLRAAEMRAGGPRREALAAMLESIGRPSLAEWARTAC